MGEVGRAEQTIRFGVFEVDLRSGEVRKSGTRIKLQEQPFKVLTVLLERPGQVISREELRNRIWPHESCGDFDHAVNVAIAKLRTALGDSAEAPHLIETLHRRGYRFIFPLTDTSSRVPNIPVVVRAPGGDNARTAGTEADITTLNKVGGSYPGLASRGRSRWTWAIVFFVLVLAVGRTIPWLNRSFPPPEVVKTVQITQDRVPKVGILTDGSRIYINETLGLKQILVQAAITGGETSVISTPFASISAYDISPDHSRILAADTSGMTEQGGITSRDLPFWQVPLAGGIPRRLGDATGHFATWSPDGRQMAFAKGSDIYLSQADGSHIQKLCTVSGLANWLRFSPGGTLLRFTLTSTSDNTSSLWEIHTDGSTLHPLLPDRHKVPGEDCCGMWSPDGRYFFFLSSVNGVGAVLALRENDGLFHKSRPVPVQLTTGPMNFAPFVPSLDGKKLIADGWLLRGELVRYDKQSHRFLPFFSDMSIIDMDFSRDGKWVAYITWPEHALWRSRVDGSERLQLTSRPVLPNSPRWSPDGKEIVYVNRQLGHPFQLFLVSADGGISRQLVSEARQEMDASWSPDGKKVVFGRVPWLNGPDETMSIQMVDLASKRVLPIPRSENLFSPRWSPDGRHLAALTSDSKKLMLFDFMSQRWTSWISGTDAISSPFWSHDSEYIYYDSSSNLSLGYRRVKVGNTRSQLIVDLNNLRRLGYWSGLAPDGSPLFIRDTSADDIYSLDLELP